MPNAARYVRDLAKTVYAHVGIVASAMSKRAELTAEPSAQHGQHAGLLNRRILHNGAFALIEEIELDAESRLNGERARFILPFEGVTLFICAGGQARLVDATRVFCVGEEGGACLVPGWGAPLRAICVTPTSAALNLLLGSEVRSNWRARGWNRVKDDRSHLITHSLRRADADVIATDGQVLELLRRALWSGINAAATPRPLVESALRWLHERRFQRTSLVEIARELNTTPKYLTNTFKRDLGVPTYRYDLRLRLNRALLDLPDCRDITELALGLGFSSHSHFSAMFTSAFGLTPSGYRHNAAGLRSR